MKSNNNNLQKNILFLIIKFLMLIFKIFCMMLCKLFFDLITSQGPKL